VPHLYKSELKSIKALVFLIKRTEELRDKYLKQNRPDQAAEAQEQLQQLKLSLFEILFAEKYSVEIKEDNSLVFRNTKP
jgi:hypothetical protein